MVTGTFILNDHYACILFYSSVEKSFVSSAFTHLINIAPATLNTSYEVELADGKVVSTSRKGFYSTKSLTMGSTCALCQEERRFDENVY
ncbi:hypothetical protein Tco_0460704 [Tanacetum coccineum]